MDIREVFQSIEKKMLTDFEQFQSQIQHSGEMGRERELVLISFLQSYLPKRYGVSSGEIVDRLGKVSHQSDIVIFDSQNCPLLLAGENYRVFPSEPVLSVVEVKSTLSKTELIDAANKIKALKDLSREDGPIGGVVFAYKTAFKREPLIKTSELLREINRDLELHQTIDLLCILDSGVTYLTNEEGRCRVPADFEDRAMFTWMEAEGPSTILWFLINLFDLLSGQRVSEPNLLSYLGKGGGIEIGVVMQSDYKN